MQTKSIISHIARLAKMEHRDLNGQLLAMIELYERTHKISAKITRKRKKKEEQKVAQPEQKKKQIRTMERSDKGKTRSDEAKKNIRMGIMKARLKRMTAEAQATQ